MFWFPREPERLTQEEKIDYLYDELKKDESHRRWSRVWSWIWRGFLIVSTYWLYLHPETMFNMLQGTVGKSNVTGQVQPGTNEMLRWLFGGGIANENPGKPARNPITGQPYPAIPSANIVETTVSAPTPNATDTGAIAGAATGTAVDPTTSSVP